MQVRETSSGLLVPANLEDRPVCAKCFVCSMEFTRPGDCERHVAKCVRQHEQEIRDFSPRQGPQDPANWDVEYERWARGEDGKWANWYAEHRLNPDGTER